MSHPIERYLLRAKDVIDTRFAEHLDVGSLAATAGYSRAHFGREFRRVFGRSPHSYLQARRLERAAWFLASSRESVAGIAVGVGWSSVGSFTSAFTRTYGVPPTAYRECAAESLGSAPVPSCMLRRHALPVHVKEQT